MKIIEEEAKRELRLQHSEALTTGKPWPPQRHSIFDWLRWVLYSIWLAPLTVLAMKGFGQIAPELVSGKLARYTVGGCVTLIAGYALLGSRHSYPRVYLLLTVLVAFLLGGKAFYDLTTDGIDLDAGLLSLAGAIYFTRDAIEEVHHRRKRVSDELT